MEDKKKDCSRYFRPIREHEMRDWRPAPKSFTTKLFEAFLDSEHKMVEVIIDTLPEPKHRNGPGKSTKRDSFASSFYAWKRKKGTQRTLKRLGINILLIRRGEKVALKKTQRSK